MKDESRSRKTIAVSFLRLVGSGEVADAYDHYVAEEFRHHNPFFRGDRASLMNAMEENARRSPNKVLDVKRTFEDGNYVIVHSHIRQNSQDRGVAAVHILRFEGDRIAELWDLGQEIPRDSPNEHGVF
jgi:predicted SnoaL-like aldol condensation-catalyzing enzyme